MEPVSYIFCNSCRHRNPPRSSFCSACGQILDLPEERTISLAKTDPLQDAPGDFDNVEVALGGIHVGQGILVVRSGSLIGERFALGTLASIGRNPECEICLDDVTVSRRHAEVSHIADSYVVRDMGSLNGTYVNQARVDEQPLNHGDELQIGKFRMVFFDGASVSS